MATFEHGVLLGKLANFDKLSRQAIAVGGLIKRKQEELALTVHLAQNNQRSEALAILHTGQGLKISEDIKAASDQLDELILNETRDLSAEGEHLMWRQRLAVGGLVALNLMFLAALAGRTGTESVAVYDRRRGVRCGVLAGRHYDSASVVKTAILAALLREAAAGHRPLTASEDALATRMITRSDNRAASALWRSVGPARLARFLRKAGMAHTTLDPAGHWGLTRITAADQITLLRRLTEPNALLTGRKPPQ